MLTVIRDASLSEDPRKVGIIEVKYPARDQWDFAGFEALKEGELAAIRKEGETYDRETWFRQHPYFRYFRKFKKSYPVMMQVESFLLKGRPFPEGEYINAVAFLAELKTRTLLGTHDVDRIKGPVVFYNETEKTPFPGMINPDSHSYPGDITGKDDEGIIISMIGGADSRTCIHEDTDHVIYLAFGTQDTTEEEIRSALEQVRTYALVLAPDAVIESEVF